MTALLFHYRGTITSLFALGLLWLAWRRAGAPEIASAATLAGMMLSQRIYNLIDSGGATIWHLADYWTVDPVNVAIDAGCFAVLLTIALRANRIYPLWMAGFQLVALVSHAPRAISSTAHPVAYSIFVYGPWYLELGALSIGLAWQIRRARSGRSYREWRPMRG